MSVTEPNFTVKWDDFLEMAEKQTVQQVQPGVSRESEQVREISQQELLFEIAADPDSIDVSIFDEPMEEELIQQSDQHPSSDMFVAQDLWLSTETSLDIPVVENGHEAVKQKRENQFVEMNTEDVRKFVNQQENKGTLRKTMGDIDKLNKFLRMKGEEREITDIPPDELDVYLSNFILSVRKADDGEFEPTSIRNMISSFDRKLRRQSYPESIINSKNAFILTKESLKAKLKSLKKQGKGNRPKEAQPITDTEINILREQKLLGDESPQALINTLWMNNTIHFGLRGVTEHYDLRWGDVSLQCTSDGTEYLELNERQSKTRTGENISDIRKVSPKMYKCMLATVTITQSSFINYIGIDDHRATLTKMIHSTSRHGQFH